MQLHQGNAVDKYQGKIEKVRQTISSNEQDLRNFISVYESTNQKWENEWRTFLDVSVVRVTRTIDRPRRISRRTASRSQRTSCGRTPTQCRRSAWRTTA